MERLSLNDFKAKSNESNELENLTGGILGACHCYVCDKVEVGHSIGDGAANLGEIIAHWMGWH